MEFTFLNERITFHISLERFIYAIIGATSVIWIWFYFAYEMCSLFGQMEAESFEIRIEVDENVKE